MTVLVDYLKILSSNSNDYWKKWNTWSWKNTSKIPEMSCLTIELQNLNCSNKMIMKKHLNNILHSNYLLMIKCSSNKMLETMNLYADLQKHKDSDGRPTAYAWSKLIQLQCWNQKNKTWYISLQKFQSSTYWLSAIEGKIKSDQQFQCYQLHANTLSKKLTASILS